MGKEVYSNVDTLFFMVFLYLLYLTSRKMELFMNCNFETVIVEE